MPRRRTSVIWKVPKEELQQVLDQSNSIVDVLKHYGLDPYNGNHKTVHSRVKFDDLCLKQLTQNRKLFTSNKASSTNRLPNEKVFCQNNIWKFLNFFVAMQKSINEPTIFFSSSL